MSLANCREAWGKLVRVGRPIAGSVCSVQTINGRGFLTNRVGWSTAEWAMIEYGHWPALHRWPELHAHRLGYGVSFMVGRAPTPGTPCLKA